MKRNTIWNVLLWVLFLLLIAGEIWAVVSIVRLDMLPVAYLAIIIVVFVLLDVGIGWLLFRNNDKSGNVRRIIGCVLAVLVLCGCAAIITVAGDVLKTIAATSKEIPDTTTREIFVLNENEAQQLADTSGFTFGYVKHFDETATAQVLDVLTEQVSGTWATAGYMNLLSMVKALENGQIDAMILNGGFIDILEETKEFAGISERVRILSQIVVDAPEVELELPGMEPQIQPQVQQTEATEAVTEPEETEPAEEIDFTQLKPFLVYVSGNDSHTEMLSSGRSDVNILAAVNPLTKQILLVNTPRDYYIWNSAGGWARDKLTHCGLYGVNCSMATLGYLYDEPVEYYVQVNFTGFKKLIDAMGGVTVYSDYAFVAITRTDIAQGENHLTGQQALDFARERYTLPGGDNERGRHQMQVIEAVIEKATSGTTIISNYSEIVKSVEGMFTMNVPQELISALMKMQLSDMAKWNVVTYSATGYDSFEKCYSLPEMDLAVIIPYESSYVKAARLIDMVFAGELLTEEVVNSIG